MVSQGRGIPAWDTVEMGYRFPPIPPKRNDGVDLSHIRVRPDGTRYADIAKLKQKPKVKAQLDAIREKIAESRQARG